MNDSPTIDIRFKKPVHIVTEDEIAFLETILTEIIIAINQQLENKLETN